MEPMPSYAPEIAPVIGPGAKLIGKLESVRRIIDERFLAACELLSQAIDGIESLIASLETLAKTLDAATVEDTTADLQMAADKLFALPVGNAERTVKIGRLSGCREEFSERISDMRCSLAYMRAIVSGVSKYFPDNAAEAQIHAFLDEITADIEQGTDEFKKLEFDLSSLQLGLETVLAQGEILEFQIEQLLPMVPDDLTSNAKVMGNHYLRVVSTAGSVAVLARDIHVRVSRMLSALQIGDITRQRIEHIQAGVIFLDTSVKLLPSDKRDQIVATLYALLAAQMSAAGSDFHREVSEIGHSMGGMASDARELLRLHDMAYGGNVDEEGGFLRKIGDQIGRAFDLVEEVEKAETTAIETVKDTSAAAQELSSRIDSIRQLKESFIGLGNGEMAQKSAEKNSPLDASILELCQYSLHLASVADGCMDVSDRLTKMAATAVRDWASGTDIDSDGAAASKALSIAAERIRHVRDKTENDIVSIVAKGDMVMNMLEVSSTRLDFQAGIGEILDQVTEDLNELGKKASPDKAQDTEILENMLNRMAKFYSMAQEREIHRSYVAALGAGSSEPDPTEFDKDDFETILF